MRVLIFLISISMFVACGDEVVVKPSAKLRLDYTAPKYKELSINCPYSFLKNEHSRARLKNNCWLNLEYPEMKATVYLTYRPIHSNNLDSLLYDAQKLTYDHTVKATEIFEQPRVDSISKVYGMFYMINGDAATQSQFYVTDSVNHFVTGSLYFDSKPNFDSIYPAVVYLRNDMRRIMETIQWEETKPEFN